MTDEAATLLALAERCEKATGPERALHWAIHAAKLGNPRPTIDELHKAPDYTASLDAAMTLVPEGWVLRLSQIRFGLWHVQLWRGDKSFRQPCDVESCTAAPAALALTAACLRAHAATMEDE